MVFRKCIHIKCDTNNALNCTNTQLQLKIWDLLIVILDMGLPAMSSEWMTNVSTTLSLIMSSSVIRDAAEATSSLGCVGFGGQPPPIVLSFFLNSLSCLTLERVCCNCWLCQIMNQTNHRINGKGPVYCSYHFHQLDFFSPLNMELIYNKLRTLGNECTISDFQQP